VLPSGSGQAVLVVEDEEAVRESTRRILAANGYSVLTAGCGAEALELCREGVGIDLLLTDVVMPGMSGRALAASIGEMKPDLRVLYMSGYTDRQLDVGDSRRLIEKPFNTETLLRGVAEALATEVAAS
jgi:CheY-like chemotaxis protein